MHAKATGGHGIGSPCKPPSRVQRVRSAIRDDGAAAAGIGAKSREQGCSKRALAEAMDGVGQSAVCGASSYTLDGIQPRNDVSPPHPNPLPQGERGSERRPPRLKQIAEA